MLQRFTSKATYANVVASLALFVALGGISYAAITLPKNSVGSKQIKRNAVTGPKIKSRTLRKSDFAKGVLPAAGTGLPGPKGDKGDKGDPADLGFLDPANDLPGSAIAELTIDANPSGTAKGYRITCPPGGVCTLSLGGPQGTNVAFESWFEGAKAEPNNPAWTKNFALDEYAAPGGTLLRRYHVSNGRPIAYRAQNGRFEITFSAEFIQRVSV